MSKYIPKVGEEFEWETFQCDWRKENAVVFVTEKQIAFINCKGFIEVISKNINFRPISTKSDVEREHLEALHFHFAYEDLPAFFDLVQKAGFTIPKKIKRSDVAHIIRSTCDSSIVTTIDCLCDLLGDLVEQAKGGAE